MIDSSFWRGRKVFLTGHTGFKGGWLAIWLSGKGAIVTGFSLEPETTPNLFEVANVVRHCSSVMGDVRDLKALTKAMKDCEPDIVLHLAAQPLVRRSYREPVETYATNVMGTVHCLEAARHIRSVRAIVVVTSDKCYENKNWVWAYRENEPMGGYDPYSNSKGCSELVTSAYRNSFFGQESGCHLGSGRAGNVIGGGDWSEDRLIPDMIRSFDMGHSVEIRSPHATRPWQHVLEPLHGYLKLAEALAGDEGHRFAEGWNFGPEDSDCKPVSYIANRLVKNWGDGAAWHLTSAPQPHEAHLLKVDASKAKTRLGWKPLLPLEEALDWTVKWYQAAGAGGDMMALCHNQIARFEAIESANI